MVALVEVFMRTIGGRVTSVELTVDEASAAVANQPWTWSLSPRSFAPWSDFNYRGEPVERPSVADRMTPP
jgi:hypothetical protein